MTSIYRRALGDAFDDLHPEIRRHYGLHSSDGVAYVGRGRMDEIRRGPWYTVPLLALGARWNLLVPDHGSNVRFRLQNVAYRDEFDRETVAWNREFRLAKTRRFDAAMVYSDRRGCVVDYLGTRRMLATDLHLDVTEDGGIRIQSEKMRLFAGPARLALPRQLAGTAEVEEWYDDGEDRFCVTVSVTNPLVGELLGYSGWFELEEQPVDQVSRLDELPGAERRE